MKKLLKTVLLVAITACIVLAGWLGIQGYRSYKTIESQAPLEQMVANAMASDKYVPADEIAPFLLQATVAVEDARFYEHNGIDPIALARAVLSQIIPSMDKSGGSTITQQVVKNLYHQYNQTLDWKVTESILALHLEQMLSKEEILALYVSIINYGDNFTGIRKASEGYFAVSPSQLNDAQASILAGIPQSPAYYQLSNHFDAAKAKQKVVLEAMVRNDMISQEQMDQIYAEPLYPINRIALVWPTV